MPHYLLKETEYTVTYQSVSHQTWVTSHTEIATSTQKPERTARHRPCSREATHTHEFVGGLARREPYRKAPEWAWCGEALCENTCRVLMWVYRCELHLCCPREVNIQQASSNVRNNCTVETAFIPLLDGRTTRCAWGEISVYSDAQHRSHAHKHAALFYLEASSHCLLSYSSYSI